MIQTALKVCLAIVATFSWLGCQSVPEPQEKRDPMLDQLAMAEHRLTAEEEKLKDRQAKLAAKLNVLEELKRAEEDAALAGLPPSQTVVPPEEFPDAEAWRAHLEEDYNKVGQLLEEYGIVRKRLERQREDVLAGDPPGGFVSQLRIR